MRKHTNKKSAKRKKQQCPLLSFLLCFFKALYFENYGIVCSVFFFLKRTFYFRKNYNYSSEDSFVSGCHCYNLICFFQVQYVVIRRNEAGCYNKQVNGSILLFLAFNPYMIYRRVCILTYILHNANFDCLIEVRTKIPLLEEAIERERVFHNSISI